MYNLDHLAIRLINMFADQNNTNLMRNNNDLEDVEATTNELITMKNYIPTTAEGYYLRFESCMKRILETRKNGMGLSADLDKDGFIYEYVKSRNYGFIIGTDFQEYFFHWSDVSKTIRELIIYNIYSGKDVENEDKIYVHFKAETVNRRTHAVDII